ncbi:hypothetical protein Patl1_12113 [Pistacia atlantica]|uniref:Uncharacterized protein n=1 Tax=Pistacia atlantica TaxID=434234 RepID=A0ACC1A1J0_9ROSI|nr:hypothetical protein Patl1_12113 [Pistacia atlantica]
MLKYGVVRMHDLVQDIMNWERCYLSGRLQKPILGSSYNLDTANTNSVNLRAALSAAPLFHVTFHSLNGHFAKICSLSYMGDLRVLVGKNLPQVKKIVQGQFDFFRSICKPFLQEYLAKDFFRVTSSGSHQANISQVCKIRPLLVPKYLIMPPEIRSQMGMKLGEKKIINEYGMNFR